MWKKKMEKICIAKQFAFQANENGSNSLDKI